MLPQDRSRGKLVRLRTASVNVSCLWRHAVIARYQGGGAVDVAEAANGAALTEGPVHV